MLNQIPSAFFVQLGVLGHAAHCRFQLPLIHAKQVSPAKLFRGRDFYHAGRLPEILHDYLLVRGC